jgi:hypothetical protein
LDFVENLALVDSREVSIFYYSKLSWAEGFEILTGVLARAGAYSMVYLYEANLP